MTAISTSRNMFRTWLLSLVIFFCALSTAFAQTWTIGTNDGANSSTSYPAPYGQYYHGAHHQMMYTASQLTAAGVTAGLIHQLAFNVTALNGIGVMESFTIQICGTTQADLSSWVAPAAFTNTVFSSASYNLPGTGWIAYTLGTPFNWNGTDNIVVDVCFFTVPGYTNNASTAWTSNAGGIYCRQAHSDVTNYCGTTLSGTTHTTRPQIQFTRLNPCTGVPTTTASGPANICPNTTFALSATVVNGGGITYQWMSANNIAGPYNNIANATNATYTVTGGITVPTYYQVFTTCTFTGQNYTSNIVSVIVNPASLCPCIPNTNGGCSIDQVTNVTFGTINNTTACNQASSPYYTYYPAPNPSFLIGNTYTLSLSTYGSPGGDDGYAWIDFNGDGIFQATENVIIGHSTGGVNNTYTATVTIPANAVAGQCLLRTRSEWYLYGYANPDPCGFYNYGESEDYLITLIAPLPAPLLTAGPDPSCSGTPVTITASGLTTGATVSWSGPGIPAGTTTTATGATATYTFNPPVAPGSYTYSVSQSVGANNSQPSTVTITVNPQPVFNTGLPSNNGPVCEGTMLALNALTTPQSASYVWTGPGLPGPDSSGNSIVINNVPVAAAGDYTVTASTPAGCSVTASTTVMVNSKPVVALTPFTSSLCSNAPSITLSGGTPTSGYYYGTGVANGMFDPSAGTQTIYYTYTDANTCKDTASQQITVTQEPVVIITELPELCSNSMPYTLYTALPPGGTYSGTGVVNGVFTPSAPGTYTITYSYSNGGCIGTNSRDIIVKDGSNSGLAGTSGETEMKQITDVVGTTEVRYADCDLMMLIDPTGADAVAGNTVVKVTLDEVVNTYNGQPYLQRHYDVEPVTATTTTTATITLYALQSEFTAYNNAAVPMGYPLLPSGGIDNGNIRITQFHGMGTNPDNYNGASVQITPSVSWDPQGYWKMTFPVTGFSGFYIHTSNNDGALSVSTTSAKDFSVSAYPNPVHDIINVSIAGRQAGLAYITLTDVTGKTVQDAKLINGSTQLNMSGLPAGMYYIKYKDEERTQVLKINKE